MGIIYIGDRNAGKTHLALELANPNNSEYVQVSEPDYEFLRAILYDEQQHRTRATDASKEVDLRELEIQVRLRSNYKSLEIDWIDTTGEIWRKNWQKNNPDKWKNFLDNTRNSEGILLILEPYRDLIKNDIDKPKFITKQQWCNRFKRWVNFFENDCPKAKRLAICLNKADLFCDIEQQSSRLAYIPSGSILNWNERYSYLLKKYFRIVKTDIQQLTNTNYNLSVNFFLTTIKNRQLLELPWIYLGTYLD